MVSGGNAPQVTVTGSAVGAGIVVAKSEDPKHQVATTLYLSIYLPICDTDGEYEVCET
jgi:hypothetical protein